MSGVERTISIDSNYPVVTIGRAVDCDIRSNRKSVSRHHAEFKFENNQVHVVDLNSSNGTFIIIDDQRRAIIGQQTISDNDEIWCGDFVLRYKAEEAPSPRQPVPTFTSSPDVSFASHPTDRPVSGSQPLGLGIKPNPGPPSPPPPQFGASASSAPPGLLEQSGFDPLTDDIDEIERLMAEKSSIEDLASRQADEIERLESLIGSVKEDAASSAFMLKTQHEKNEEEKKRLKEKIDAQKSNIVVIDLENEVVDLRAMNEKLRAELAESGNDIKDAYESTLIEKDKIIDELGNENQKLASLNDDIDAQLEREKSEKQNLLSQLDELKETLSSKENAQAEEAKLEEEFHTLQKQMEEIQKAYDLLQNSTESLQKTNENLNQHNEDQRGLIADLNDQILELQKNENLTVVQHDDGSNEELLTFLTSLERLTDAIQRTDFSVLSTVDRVRLQSAIRETKPKETLQAFIEKNK